MAPTPAQAERVLDGILAALVQRSGALTALLIAKEGTNAAEAGDTSFINTTSMAALIAGMFSATREVAKMVGEDQFSLMLQQGKARHLHISLLADRQMLVVIFEDYQRAGRVRHEAKRATEDLDRALEAKGRDRSVQDELASPQFKEYALNLIDRIFATK